MFSPKIEPEIVFKIAIGAKVIGRSADGTAPAPADVLESVEWLALGFEIIDCVFPDWKFQPADFVAAYGLHAALIVGEPHASIPRRSRSSSSSCRDSRVRLSRDDEVVAEGSGRNSLRSPALCLAELDSGDCTAAWRDAARGRAISSAPGR